VQQQVLLQVMGQLQAQAPGRATTLRTMATSMTSHLMLLVLLGRPSFWRHN
jgi:hypothetical protein